MTSKSIIVDLNKGEKRNGDNYDIWSRKIWYVLEEQNALEEGNTAQHRRDLEANKAWKKANSIARGIIVSSVVDDLIHECEQFPTAHATWAYLRGMYGDEQQVQLVIRSLPNNWEHLKVNLTHNDSIKTFSDVARHVELEDERLGATKAASNAFVAESSGTKSSGFKRKKNWKINGKDKETGKGPSKKKKKPNSKKGKRSFKKRDKSKMKCYNCQELRYLARECTEPKKVAFLNASLSATYVSSTSLLTESYPMWIVDSGSTDHVSRDREAFVEFHLNQGGST
ncbi:hypothetical protein KY285_009077 [Solanum tuberosum]|nr:hypothetical protein KY285_009077 [Solanum tuberosum]